MKIFPFFRPNFFDCFRPKLFNISTIFLNRFIGIAIMIISILLLFILHFKTQVKNGSIILDGLWTSRKIKIDTGSIVSVKKVQYSKYFLNRAVYNLHFKGTIRFYTRGDDAVELIDKDGLVYLIGSQKAEELTRVIQEKLI